MRPITHRFTLDMHDTQSQISIPVLRGDSRRKLCITLSEGGNPYTIEDGCYAYINIRRPSDVLLEYFCTIENNTTIVFDFSVSDQVVAVEGVHACDITLFDANYNVITSPRFSIIVIDQVTRSTDIEIDDEDKTLFGQILVTEASRQENEKERQENEEKREAFYEETKNARVGKKYNNGTGEIFNDYDNNVASGARSKSDGYDTKATGDYSYAGGWKSEATGHYANAWGIRAKATGKNTYARGADVVASADHATADGNETEADGIESSAHGYKTRAHGRQSVADGSTSIAFGTTSAAHNERTIAYGQGSTSEGGSRGYPNYDTHIVGHDKDSLKAKWESNKNFVAALGSYSHAGGYDCCSYGTASYAMGDKAYAKGVASSAFGIGTIASADAQTVVGKYNAESSTALFIVGNGTSDTNRNNAFIVSKEGYVYANGGQLATVTYADNAIGTANEAKTRADEAWNKAYAAEGQAYEAYLKAEQALGQSGGGGGDANYLSYYNWRAQQMTADVPTGVDDNFPDTYTKRNVAMLGRYEGARLSTLLDGGRFSAYTHIIMHPKYVGTLNYSSNNYCVEYILVAKGVTQIEESVGKPHVLDLSAFIDAPFPEITQDVGHFDKIIAPYGRGLNLGQLPNWAEFADKIVEAEPW